MNSFGEVTDFDRRGWQLRALAGLTRLLDVGWSEPLPPLLWIVHGSGLLIGEVDTAHPAGYDPVTTFEAWRLAVQQLPDSKPRGLGPLGEGPTTVDHVDEDGLRQLSASFTLCTTASDWPRCNLVLAAEWLPDDIGGVGR